MSINEIKVRIKLFLCEHCSMVISSLDKNNPIDKCPYCDRMLKIVGIVEF